MFAVSLTQAHLSAEVAASPAWQPVVLSDTSDILTATLLSEGDEGHGRVITSQRTDQGHVHEGIDSLCEYSSGSLIAKCMCFFFFFFFFYS